MHLVPFIQGVGVPTELFVGEGPTELFVGEARFAPFDFRQCYAATLVHPSPDGTRIP